MGSYDTPPQPRNCPSSSPTPCNPNQPNRSQLEAHGQGACKRSQPSLDPTEHDEHHGISWESPQCPPPSHPIANNNGDGCQAHKSHRPGDEMVAFVLCFMIKTNIIVG